MDILYNNLPIVYNAHYAVYGKILANVASRKDLLAQVENKNENNDKT